MIGNIKTFETTIGGKKVIAEFSDLAPQSNGSVLVRMGDSVVLANVVMSKEPRPGASYFPLTVDFEEKFYASGRMPGMRFVRREGRPSEHAVLTGRVIDRTIRPLFNQKMRYDVQVTVMVLSFDSEHSVDALSVLASSLALHTSDVPWNGPVGSVRVGMRQGELLVNPLETDRKQSDFELIVSGKDQRVNMIEGKSKGAREEDLERAIERAITEITEMNRFQDEVRKQMGKKKIEPILPPDHKELESLFQKNFLHELQAILSSALDKQSLNIRYHALGREWKETAIESFPEVSADIVSDMFEAATDIAVHELALRNGKRVDGRKFDEVRPLAAKAAVIPRAHGSGLFFRGDTHILSAVTLGPPAEEMLVYTMTEDVKKRFIHQYNFPPFSVGETGRMGSPGRREIGHGALAEKALEAVIPNQEEFPYVIRVVSETMSSNGSSSMGSVSAASIAHMDAGIPIREPVAGIAMGLLMDEGSKYQVLTDLQGFEDHYGDMDFKVAGTRDHITAVQLDSKVDGITMDIIRDTFRDAKIARVKVLETILSAIPEPRKELSPYAPRIVTLHINPDKIRELIGPGGKMINAIIDETGCDIDIEQDGTVFISSPSPEALERAVKRVKEVTREPEVGEVYDGRVSRIFQFGAMVEIGPNHEGLVHISELAPYRVGEVTDIVHVGDQVPVKVIGIDDLGRVNLSIKAVTTLEPKQKSDGARSNEHGQRSSRNPNNRQHSKE